MPGRVMPRPLVDYFSRFYYDTAVGGSAAAIRYAYEVSGAGLVFSADISFGPSGVVKRFESYPAVAGSPGLTDDENIRIFEDNARMILGLVQGVFIQRYRAQPTNSMTHSQERYFDVTF